MKKRVVGTLLLGVASLALAQTSKMIPTPDVTVRVDSSNRISVSPNGQTVAANQSSVVWWISTEGFAFASNSGIDFGGAASYFNCSMLYDGRGMRCSKSSGAPTGAIAYSLRLVSTRGGPVESDPGIFIQNE